MQFKQYSVVKLKELYKNFDPSENSTGSKLPQVGDEATIVEVYTNPTLGYELESVGENGATNWLVTFSPDDAQFELLHENT